MTVIQWVNLEKHDEYAKDPDIGSKDRCGALEVKSAFKKANIPLLYKVKVSPSGSDNVTYSKAELGRNSNFKMTKGTVDIGAKTEVSLSDKIKLPAAGGNKYKLEAKDDNGKVVESAEVEAKRKLYYQFMHMEDSNGKVTPYSLSQLESHCQKYHIKLSKAGSDKKIPFRKCINTGAGGRFSHVGFASDVSAKYDLAKPLKRVGCVTALSNYIATFKEVDKHATLVLGAPANPLIKKTATDISIQVLTKNDFLWYGLDDDDDTAKRWFVDGEIKFTPTPVKPSAKNTSSSTAAPPPPPTPQPKLIPLSSSDVEIDGTAKRTYGGHQKIKIKINKKLKDVLANKTGTIKFSFTINQVKGFSGGFSWGGAGFALTTCCTKAWFEDKRASASNVIWNHELGHRIGMVAYGDKNHTSTNTRFHHRPKLPDSPPNLYGENRGVNDKGHQGPHCEQGSVTYNAVTRRWTGIPGCVLFGATGTSAASSPLDYCSDCEPVVRKLDLSF